MKIIRHAAAALLFVGLPSLSFVACNSNPAVGLCNDYCDCEGCSDKELDDCEAAAEKSFDTAEKEGCSEEFDAYAECLEASFKCDGDNAKYTDTCSSENSKLTECAGVAIGVGGNTCEIAANICGAGGESQGECSGASQCAAQCIVDANSCDFAEANSPLVDCITNCT